MDTEILLLLAVPLAFLIFGLGWLAARVDIKHLLETSKTLPRTYFRGLNYLLNEQPDRAIDSFIQALQADSDTLDLHFTLGAMFRRRGESDRAIRIHQSLLARPDLKLQDRERATFELGQDFLKAGMLDRAETHFSSLVESSQAEPALTALMEVFEIEKEWHKAIQTAQQIEQTSGQNLQQRIAHFYCEIAQSALAQSKLDDAQAALQQALSFHRASVRASILAGDIAQAKGETAQALQHWLAIEKQNVLFLALVAQRVVKAMQQLGQDAQATHLLQAWLAQSSSFDVMEALFRETLAQQSAEEAHALVLAELKRTPTLIGLDKLVESRIGLASANVREELDIVKNLLHQQARRLSRYTCGQCGFKARQFYWQCPGCRQWDTYWPRRAEELEMMK